MKFRNGDSELSKTQQPEQRAEKRRGHKWSSTQRENQRENHCLF